MARLMRQIPWGKALLILLGIWFLMLLMALGLLRHEVDTQTNQRISQALRDLQSLHNQREEINKLLTEFTSGANSLKQDEKQQILKTIHDKISQQEPFSRNELGSSLGIGPYKINPPKEYEKMRRKLHNDVDEMWYFINTQLNKIQKESKIVAPQIAQKLMTFVDLAKEHRRSLLKDIDKLKDVDNYDQWRLKEAQDLSDLVQKRIKYLQNPDDCKSARKLVCNLNKACGYGCQLHHAVYCLLVAYGTERTLILKSVGWRYNRSGWEKVFLPFSDTCTSLHGEIGHNWPGKPTSQVVSLGIIDSVVPRPQYLPLAVPKDLASRIERIHGDPPVWWVGQFLKYILRPQPETIELLQQTAAKFNYQHPIVGVHIRRTDKVGTEAAFHSVDEYMAEVEEYYNQLALKEDVSVKRIYLATDDPKVFTEIQQKYPNYQLLGDPQIAKTASVSTRYSDSSLTGIIIDIYFLSQSDYLVCTFSSQVCRVAYEIMQSLHPDASSRFRSLDDIYYYGGQGVHRRIAVIKHKAASPDEIDLEVGDHVGVAGNHWNGYSKGRNLRTNQVGLYPSFKVEDLIEAVDFPTYKEVKLQDNQDELV